MVKLIITDIPNRDEAVFRDIYPLIEKLENPIGIEIGIYEATNSWWLLHTHPTLRLYGVDPYVEYQDWYPGGHLSQSSVNRAYDIMRERLDKFGDRWTHYRTTSDDAVSKFEDESFDFVFIDGLHEYDQVLKDCRNYYSKVKSGGIFSGHDYGAIEGVRNAVNEFAAEVGQTKLTHCKDSDAWFWIKP